MLNYFIWMPVSGTVPLIKKLKATASPHIFNWMRPKTTAAINREDRATKRRGLQTHKDHVERTELEDFPLEVGSEIVIEPSIASGNNHINIFDDISY